MIKKLLPPVSAVITILLVIFSSIVVTNSVVYSKSISREYSVSSKYTTNEVTQAMDIVEEKIRWSPFWYNRSVSRLEYKEDIHSDKLNIAINCVYTESKNPTEPKEYIWHLTRDSVNADWKIQN
jgi:hypothetical protein